MANSCAPRACGAIGSFDRARVVAASTALGDGMRVVHEDEHSILLLDRRPVAWEGRSERGFGWNEGGLWRVPARTWQDASLAGVCGLVVGGRRPFLHSSVSGLAPIYWIDGDGATYFCSRIDPLVQAVPERLSIDWEAWASIIALRYPLGGRTPFEEVRRLGPHSRLRRRLRGARIEAPAWPWGEIEPGTDLEDGVEAAAEALRESLAPLEGEVLCPLSGGHDSRALCSAIPATARGIALTVGDDEGERHEEAIAEEVAAALDMPWEELTAPAEDYARDWEERARRVEYQFVDHAWLMPLARRVDGRGSPVLDGFALDTFQQTGARFDIDDVLNAHGRASDEALFESLRQFGDASLALSEPMRDPIVDRSRSQFLASTRPYWGHPSQPILSTYVTRSICGVARYPGGLLGQGAEVIVPGTHDPVASTLLSVSSAAKAEGRMRDLVQARLDPRAAEIRSTTFTARKPPVLPRRWRSDQAVEMHRSLLRDGPLSEHVAPELHSWLDDPARGELDGGLRLGMEAISMLHLWWRRYAGHLREVEGGDLA